MLRRIAIDFDGVVHADTSPWTNHHTIPDGPVDGAIAFLNDLAGKEYELHIVTSRMTGPAPDHCRNLIKQWLKDNGLNCWSTVVISNQKPDACWLTLDDRAICFDGTFDADLMDAIERFASWRQQPQSELPTQTDSSSSETKVWDPPDPMTQPGDAAPDDVLPPRRWSKKKVPSDK